MKLVWVGTVLVVLLLSSSVTCGFEKRQAGDAWWQRKNSHTPRTLSQNDRRLLAGMSSSVEEFKQALEPMLIVRPPGSRNNKITQEHIIDWMKNLDWTVTVDEFTEHAPNGRLIPFNNIVSTLDPHARRRLVLACHFDSLNLTNFIGATDSAVPCAMLLDLARTMDHMLKASTGSQTQSGSDLTLQFVFFDGEEAFERWTRTDSLYGSRHLANVFDNTPHPQVDSPTNLLDGIDVMVLLDLLGARNPRISSYFDATQDLFERLRRIESNLAKSTLLSQHHSISGAEYFERHKKASHGYIEDDHIPFLAKGVRILHIIPTPFPAVWHNTHGKDDRTAIDLNTVDDLNKIFRIFVAEYLRLRVRSK